MGDETVVLAFSGGLDSSVILAWLVEKGYEVVTYTADVGQQADLENIKERALAIGASKAYVVDVKQAFVEEYIFQALKANALYEGSYLLGTALARMPIAKGQVEVAKKVGTTTLAHGCTGKGNDQIRFELTWSHFMPEVTVVAPWRDKEFLSRFKGREDLMAFAKERGLPVPATPERPYSIDENLMHTSYEGGIIEDLKAFPPPHIFNGFTFPTEAPDEGEVIEVGFQEGVPAWVKNATTGEEVKGSVALLNYLNKVGGRHGVGLVDMVESRIIGIKSRGIYIAPAATILWALHKDLERVVLEKGALHLKEVIGARLATLIYHGLWYSEEAQMLMAAVEASQKKVNGRVKALLYKGNVIIQGRDVESGRYSSTLASMERNDVIRPEDVEGYINLLKLQHRW